ncbi:B12-binding domain-containing radical SAM protein [Synergistaceae bacterium OttesenSCG-928-I11]|nr:B12-binding domain-containing radical SAM protein [Synergistaceae bacterium OttesenSCG-928-I11]
MSALFFPADYSVGMANLGFHYIYRVLAELGVAVERFFYSPIPYRSVERDTMLERFPIVFASISYEGDVPRFSEWLSRGGIVPSRRDRQQNDAQLLGVGGAITYINPLSLSDIADFIVLGDAVSLIPFLVETLRATTDRGERLRRLAEHPSFLVPMVHIDQQLEMSRSVHKTEDLDDEYGHANWVTPRTVFGKTLLVELQRGCVGACRYCTLPSCFRPFRQRDVRLVERDIREVSKRVFFDRVGLVTPEASDYGPLDDLLALIERLDKGVSFASLRVDGLTPRMVDALTRGGRHSMTIAPESGDDDLRRTCGKLFTNEEIVRTMCMARDRGISNAKLYFMIGLPGETDDHVVSIATLCGCLREETGLRINAAVSPFVPKPGTAWASMSFEGESALKRKIRLLTRAFSGRSGSSLQVASVKEACVEYALSWGTVLTSRDISTTAAGKGAKKWKRHDVDRNRVREELGRLGL